MMLYVIVATIVVVVVPSPCLAASVVSSSHATTRGGSDPRAVLLSFVDGLSRSGIKGMATYLLGFTLWTMTVGATTPVEIAAGMAFPLRVAIILSASGKIGGACLQYALSKYLFSDHARVRMRGNAWMDKIDASFESHPYRVALVWRFSPMPEFVKNVGPSLVSGLRTRYQLLATITHGLPFTILWSCMGNEAAIVARGGQASVLLKRMVAAITWIGLVASPTLFGWWIKGLGESAGGGGDDDGQATVT
ncbi:hypothetical protein ACHAW5_000798 [Stephanodiscus triporus]|uniref:VTT domain-containing protein n=1 Tax=Stephanodiscus triporus TaxID=2934178 RepID=A0ABD3MMI5_9STRA